MISAAASSKNTTHKSAAKTVVPSSKKNCAMKVVVPDRRCVSLKASLFGSDAKDLDPFFSDDEDNFSSDDFSIDYLYKSGKPNDEWWASFSPPPPPVHDDDDDDWVVSRPPSKTKSLPAPPLFSSSSPDKKKSPKKRTTSPARMTVPGDRWSAMAPPKRFPSKSAQDEKKEQKRISRSASPKGVQEKKKPGKRAARSMSPKGVQGFPNIPPPPSDAISGLSRSAIARSKRATTKSMSPKRNEKLSSSFSSFTATKGRSVSPKRNEGLSSSFSSFTTERNSRSPKRTESLSCSFSSSGQSNSRNESLRSASCHSPLRYHVGYRRSKKKTVAHAVIDGDHRRMRFPKRSQSAGESMTTKTKPSLSSSKSMSPKRTSSQGGSKTRRSPANQASRQSLSPSMPLRKDSSHGGLSPKQIEDLSWSSMNKPVSTPRRFQSLPECGIISNLYGEKMQRRHATTTCSSKLLAVDLSGKERKQMRPTATTAETTREENLAKLVEHFNAAVEYLDSEEADAAAAGAYSLDKGSTDGCESREGRKQRPTLQQKHTGISGYNFDALMKENGNDDEGSHAFSSNEFSDDACYSGSSEFDGN